MEVLELRLTKLLRPDATPEERRPAGPQPSFEAVAVVGYIKVGVEALPRRPIPLTDPNFAPKQAELKVEMAKEETERMQRAADHRSSMLIFKARDAKSRIN
jgi:hypothetical protein